MSEQRRKVVLPNGIFEGVDVAIESSNEKWSEVVLTDGATLRIKPNVISVTRLDGQYDNEGNPMYALSSSQQMTVINVPAHLRKQTAASGKAH